MADERRIVIELKLKGKGEGGFGEKKDTDLTDALQAIGHPIKSLEKATLGKSAFIYYIYNQVKNGVINGARYKVGRYFNLTENYKAEQDLENTLSVIEHTASLGSSIVNGAVVGSTVGPVGTAAGAILGAGFWAGNTGINALKSWDAQNRALSTTRIQAGFQQTRLGLIDDGRGTQN
ncbi:MAG: hypothetical protein K5765_06805 [Clostridia bacterium]|nr:hypothetical protein [Clostridia bacterium]